MDAAERAADWIEEAVPPLKVSWQVLQQVAVSVPLLGWPIFLALDPFSFAFSDFFAERLLTEESLLLIDAPGPGDVLFIPVGLATGGLAALTWWSIRSDEAAALSLASQHEGIHCCKANLETLGREIRTKTVDIRQPFDPAAFFARRHKAYATLVLRISIPVFLLGVVFFGLERMTYVAFFETRIEFRTLMNLSATSVDYRDLSELSVVCGEGEIEPRLAWTLDGPKGEELGPAPSPGAVRSLAEEDLAVWRLIDRAIRTGGVPFNTERYDPETCPAELADFLGPDLAREVEPLFTPTP
ncbi:hypothetical protein [Parvularcula lutaonensis]|uniref:Uncharacterized protein n=1 Tax=Parvularcula lutaonensis TaxID=491923 RepID=A0ABV7M865_9PROT|nr:hypothetical protein [Parvularcula lutaonensis]GGY41209.1 hypothetical protein GCM10007148_07240 [Parvularcula lutaonensis]